MTMTIFLWAFIGIMVGIGAFFFIHRPHDIEEDVIVGIIGSFLGGFLLTFFAPAKVVGFSFPAIAVGLFGAALLEVFTKTIFHNKLQH